MESNVGQVAKRLTRGLGDQYCVGIHRNDEAQYFVTFHGRSVPATPSPSETVGQDDYLSTTSANPDGETFHIEATGYVIAPSPSRFLPTRSLDKIKRKSTHHGLATVFTVPASGNDACATVDQNWIQKAVKDYEIVDDAFHQAFLTTVVFNGEGMRKPRVTPEAKQHLTQLGTQDIVLCSDIVDLPPGPYYRTGHQLRDVWKLEDDTYGTCMVTVAPMTK